MSELKEADLSRFKRTYNPCDECPYGIEKRDGSGNDSMCKICEFKELLNRRAEPGNNPLTFYNAICSMSMEKMATFLSAGWNNSEYEDGDYDPEIMKMLQTREPVSE